MAQQPPFLFYSDMCEPSANLISQMKPYPQLMNGINFICTDKGQDGRRVKCPPNVKSTPSILVNGQVYKGKNAFDWIAGTIQQIMIEQQEKQQQFQLQQKQLANQNQQGPNQNQQFTNPNQNQNQIDQQNMGRGQGQQAAPRSMHEQVKSEQQGNLPIMNSLGPGLEAADCFGDSCASNSVDLKQLDFAEKNGKQFNGTYETPMIQSSTEFSTLSDFGQTSLQKPQQGQGQGNSAAYNPNGPNQYQQQTQNQQFKQGPPLVNGNPMWNEGPKQPSYQVSGQGFQGSNFQQGQNR